MIHDKLKGAINKMSEYINPDYSTRMQADVHKADLAKQVLDNPVFQEAWSILEEANYNLFCKTKPDDVDTLQAIRLQQGIIIQLKGRFESLVQNGKISQKQLDEMPK